MAYVNHKFGRTHYTRKGRQGKTPIVWLHGGPGGMHQPSGNVFKLADERQVYCYTQIGGGKSSKTPKKHWTIPTFVAELGLLIDEWGLKEFHLMGGSWGTTLALEYYLRRKGKGVKSLVFQSPLFNSRDWKADGKRLITGLPRKTQHIINTCHDIGATDSKVYKEAMSVFYSKHVLRNKMKSKAANKQKNPNGELIYEYMWGPSEFEPNGTLRAYTRTRDLPKIKVPTMIICGEHDEATPGTGRKYSRKIKGCTFVELEGASHAIWLEKPAVLKRTILKFVNSIED
jgi:proline iminopeptidase